MAQIATTIRMDSELKGKFDCLCEEFGMSINTAFNIFAKAVVRTRSIPFAIETEEAYTSGKLRNAFEKLREEASDMDISLDEINSEISKHRSERK